MIILDLKPPSDSMLTINSFSVYNYNLTIPNGRIQFLSILEDASVDGRFRYRLGLTFKDAPFAIPFSDYLTHQEALAIFNDVINGVKTGDSISVLEVPYGQ